MHSPFGPDASLPFERLNFSGMAKSPSSNSLPMSQSHRSSVELPLPLVPPVVGESQRTSLPPLPGSARSAGTGTGMPIPPQGTYLNGNPDFEPYERSPVTQLGSARRESVERRHAGTAQWVFDRQNSAGSDAYKSLITFLDQQSPRTVPFPLESADASEGCTTTGPSPRTPTGAVGTCSPRNGGTPHTEDVIHQVCAVDEEDEEDEEEEEEEEEPELPWAEPSAAELPGIVPIYEERLKEERVAQEERENMQVQEESAESGNVAAVDDVKVLNGGKEELAVGEEDGAGAGGTGALSRVSSLTESVLQDMGEALAQFRMTPDTSGEYELLDTKSIQVTPFAIGEVVGAAPDNQTLGCADGTGGALPKEGRGGQDVVFLSNEGGGGTIESTSQAASRRHSGTLLGTSAGRLHLNMGKRAPRTGDDVGDDRGAGSPNDSTAATAGDGQSPPLGQTDPFSFPTTSPSDHGEQEKLPNPMFGSWPSFKNLGSPARSTGGGYCSTEEELTPGSQSIVRRDHRARLNKTSSSNNIAGLPPAGPGLALKFPQHVRRSSSQGLAVAASSPMGGGQYGDLALYEYDEDAFEEKYDVFDLKIIHRRGATGFEPTRELPLRINDLIGGRYQIVDLLGQAAFCRAVQALDLRTGALVCLKVVKNNKDYFDQSLDEVKVLRYVNAADPGDEYGILRLYDCFYFKEHLILVTELLRANLYEFAKHNRESGAAPYFTLPRIQSVARQVLRSLAFLGSLGLVHADLKPENILMKSYSGCEVKVIDLGSSCFLTDQLSSYVQSRSYRAPEVILGLPYGQKIDVWSLGCIIAELATGRVLFHNAAPVAILARIEGILGPIPQHLLIRGRYSPRFFTPDGKLFERNRQSGQLEFLRPKKTSLARRVPQADAGMLDFLGCLLQVDPSRRPTAAEALQHPWLHQRY